MGYLLAILGIIAVGIGLSLLITCGIIWLICLCFGLVFSWKIAIGIWLILCLVEATVKSNHN